jgi:hypothetical protein
MKPQHLLQALVSPPALKTAAEIQGEAFIAAWSSQLLE